MAQRNASSEKIKAGSISLPKMDMSLLSDREREVVSYAAAGRIDKEIAKELGISVNTLRTYWSRIRLKLGRVPRYSMVAQYIEEAAQSSRSTVKVEFSPDWELDLNTLIFNYLTDQPHPAKNFSGTHLDALILLIAPEDRERMLAVVERAKRGELDAFYYSAAYASSGEVGTAYVQVVRDASGQPLKMLGRRISYVER
jgi:DNA-binding CsgD family transcriptional regulator